MLLPVGFGLYIFDKRRLLVTQAAEFKAAPPGIFHRNLRVLLWTEMALLCFGAGGKAVQVDIRLTLG